MSIHDNSVQSTKSKVQVGDAAPDFTLPTQAGMPVSLKDFTGKTAIVLYFYPKDNTSGGSAALGLLPGRVTYIIDKQGIVRHVFSAQFAAEKHVTEALRVLQTLQNASTPT